MVRVFSSRDIQEFLSRLSPQGSKATSWLVRLLLRRPARLIWVPEVGLDAAKVRQDIMKYTYQCTHTVYFYYLSKSQEYEILLELYVCYIEPKSCWVLPSCPKLKRVPDGDVRLEPGENGELLTESCRPLVEWERSQSRASSWPRSWGDGPYLQDVKDKV